ncbi:MULTISPECIES: alpha/beta fold hydrolase [unclassified Frankia]|uniref:alpha/beta fold hydrolase n=1 Tax=unclassified Frankia TaxID=2632575 RepID=UPI0020259458
MPSVGSRGALDFVAVGDGPGVVLVHGTGADATSNWEPLIDAVGGRRRVVAPNLPGAGDTPASAAPLDVEVLVEQLLVAVDAGGVQGQFDLVGHSLGAVLAAAVAAAAPERVRSLFLHAGWVRSGPRERLMFELWARLLEADTALLARSLVLSAMSPGLLAEIGQRELGELVAGFEGLVDQRIAGQIELDGRIDISGLLAAVRAPTLVLASADDQIVPSRHQRALAGAIVGASYQEVPGGHGLPFEDPERFVSIIVGFLDAQQATCQADDRRSSAPRKSAAR